MHRGQSTKTIQDATVREAISIREGLGEKGGEGQQQQHQESASCNDR